MAADLAHAAARIEELRPGPAPLLAAPAPLDVSAAAPLADYLGGSAATLTAEAERLAADSERSEEVASRAAELIAQADRDLAAIAQSMLRQAAATVAAHSMSPLLMPMLPRELGRVAELHLAAAGERARRLGAELDALIEELYLAAEAEPVADAPEAPLPSPAAPEAAPAPGPAWAGPRGAGHATALPATPAPRRVAANSPPPAVRAAPLAAPPAAQEASAWPGAAPRAGGGGEGASAEAGERAVAAARRALGMPYVWGGNGEVGFDCSGLTRWAWAEAGVAIPRTAAEQASGVRVALEDLRPGDLIVWDGHVAMYAGGGRLIEAGNPVQEGPLRTTNAGMRFLGFWRPAG